MADRQRRKHDAFVSEARKASNDHVKETVRLRTARAIAVRAWSEDWNRVREEMARGLAIPESALNGKGL